MTQAYFWVLEQEQEQEQIQYNQPARWPVVNLQGIAQHTLGSKLPGMVENQAGVSLNISVPFYQGGHTSASVQQAQALAVGSVDRVANVRDEVTLNTQTAFLNLKDSVAQLRAAKATLASARISLKGTRKGYEVGTRSIIDLLQTATDYIRAEQDYKNRLLQSGGGTGSAQGSIRPDQHGGYGIHQRPVNAARRVLT